MATAQNQFDNVFRELGSIIGADVMPDENGVVTLNVGDDVALSIEVPVESAFVYFHSPVERLVGKDRAGALEAAMRRNLFGLSVSGAWLALDSSTDELLLCYSALGDDLTADKLLSIVDALGVAVREARTVNSAPHDATASEDGKSLSPDDDFIRV